MTQSIGYAARSTVDGDLWKALNEHLEKLEAALEPEEEGVEESLFYAMAR